MGKMPMPLAPTSIGSCATVNPPDAVLYRVGPAK
jgi:hypothetical protein